MGLEDGSSPRTQDQETTTAVPDNQTQTVPNRNDVSVDLTETMTTRTLETHGFALLFEKTEMDEIAADPPSRSDAECASTVNSNRTRTPLETEFLDYFKMDLPIKIINGKPEFIDS